VAVPAPALSELLVTDGADVQDVLTTLRGSSFIRIESFDERAAVELAMRLREARKAGDRREGLPITKSAMKFDRQIVAISLVCGARVLYSDDERRSEVRGGLWLGCEARDPSACSGFSTGPSVRAGHHGACFCGTVTHHPA
jgi:hypothetical protein